jgi:EpsI family protein
MRQSTRLLLSGAVLLTGLLALQLRSPGEAVPIRRALDAFPNAIGGWQSRQDTSLQTDIVNLLKIDDYLMRRYVDEAGRSLWLYVGYWASQRRGAAQVHSPRNCLPASGWEPIEASRLMIAVGGRPEPLTVNRYLIQKDRELQVVVYWYHAQGAPIAGEIPAKIQMMRSAILRNRTDGALVRVSSPVSGSVPETTQRLVRYVQALYPRLGEYLPD